MEYGNEGLVQNDDAAQRQIDGSRQRKRTRLHQQTRCNSVKYLHITTNKVERLLSRAKIVVTDLHLELLMLLRMNRRLWNEMTVEEYAVQY